MQTARTDQDYISDILLSEKQLCSTYTTAATEAKTEPIRNELKNILACELDVQNQIFQTLENKGWYQTENADNTKIEATKSKFQNPQF